MSPDEIIYEAREIRAELPDDDKEAKRCSVFESDYYDAKSESAKQTALRNISEWIVHNRHRAATEVQCE